MTVRGLSDLLDRDLRRLYCIESEVFGVLPDLARLTCDPSLTEELERHRALTLWQRERLQMIPRADGLALHGDYCHDVAGILRQSRDFLHRVTDRYARDAAAITGMRRIQGIQRADYESAISHARALEEPRCVELLQRSLEEEIQVDNTLAELQGKVAETSAPSALVRIA